MNDQYFNHTKVDQWNAFSKIVEQYKNDYSECYELEDLNVQQHLEHYVNNINEHDKEIPLIIACLSYDLYMSIADYPITFQQFSNHIKIHIDNYVTPQYGNFPDKTIKKFTAEKIQGKLEAYTDRIGKSSRGRDDEIRDSLKIGHFACYLYCLITIGDAQNMPKPV